MSFNMKLEEAKNALAMTVEEIAEMEVNLIEQDENLSMGKYGVLAWDYLKEQHPSRFQFLLTETTLLSICQQIDKEAQSMMETLQEQLRKKIPRPKGDYIATVQYESSIREQAEEVVLRELVYNRLK